jgi:formylglycine-generating enzyme required for sulfatase activity
MKYLKIFLASSSELHKERDQFALFVGQQNRTLVAQGFFLELVVLEDFLDAMSAGSLQDEYNKAALECDIVVMLYWTKIDKHGAQAFGAVFKPFNATVKPFVYTYFKDTPTTVHATPGEAQKLSAFQQKISDLGHSFSLFTDVEALKFDFSQQLKELAGAKFEVFKRAEDVMSPTQAFVEGGSVVVQGSGIGVGAGGALIEGNSSAQVNTGTQAIETSGGGVFQAPVHAGGNVIGRDLHNHFHTHGANISEASSVIGAYLRTLRTELTGLQLGEIDTSVDQAQNDPLELIDIYVPLDTTLFVPKHMTLRQWHATRKSTVEATRGRESRQVTALEALAEHRNLTVLGKPGSGKSTFGATVLLTLARACLEQPGALEQLGPRWAHGCLLPIRIVLRRFAESLPSGGQDGGVAHLWDFVASDLKASGHGMSDNTMQYVRQHARDHGALFLLDGLDECGDAARQQSVMVVIQALMMSADKCRFLLTARPYAFPAGADPSLGVYMLADLKDYQVDCFIDLWYAALVKRKWSAPGEAARKKEDLLQAWRRPDLLPMALNPLLLTLMVTLHTNRGRLPDDRADLYKESVDLLMMRWNKQIGAHRALLDELKVPDLKLADLREAMQELAFNVHEKNLDPNGAADIGELQLLKAFCPLMGDDLGKAQVVVEYIEQRAGLLVGQGNKAGDRQFSFPHRTFQEYLAACHLASRDDFPVICAQLALAAPAHWQVVLSLAARLAGSSRGASAADELIGSMSISDFRAKNISTTNWESARLAGLQLLEIGLGAINKGGRIGVIAERVVGWLNAGLAMHPLDGGAPSAQRARAGDVLARLGDPRFDPQRLHLPKGDLFGFVHIPADPQFKIGTRSDNRERVTSIVGADVRSYEINDVPTPTNEFYIGCYPVTVAQFRAYSEATGIPPGAADTLRAPDNRPVCFVSWHEAMAYCAWLQEQFCVLPVLRDSGIGRLLGAAGWQLTLPSELEWEKAARGTLVGAVYPWGDEPDHNRANYRNSGIGETSPVGCFPANGYGLHDMAGNVWEWTGSIWTGHAFDPNAIELEAVHTRFVNMLVRGGSWNGSHGNARCAYRSRDRADLRYPEAGFRVSLRRVPGL